MNRNLILFTPFLIFMSSVTAQALDTSKLAECIRWGESRVFHSLSLSKTWVIEKDTVFSLFLKDNYGRLPDKTFPSVKDVCFRIGSESREDTPLNSSSMSPSDQLECQKNQLGFQPASGPEIDALFDRWVTTVESNYLANPSSPRNSLQLTEGYESFKACGEVALTSPLVKKHYTNVRALYEKAIRHIKKQPFASDARGTFIDSRKSKSAR